MAKHGVLKVKLMDKPRFTNQIPPVPMKGNALLLILCAGSVLRESLVQALQVPYLHSALAFLSVTESLYLGSADELSAFLAEWNPVTTTIEQVLVVVEPLVGAQNSQVVSWAETLRRDWGVRAPFIFVSFERQDSLAALHSLANLDVPGSFSVFGPNPLEDLASSLKSATEVGEEELSNVVRAHCHWEETMCVHLHDLLNALHGTNDDKTFRIWSDLLRTAEGAVCAEEQEIISQTQLLLSSLETNRTTIKGHISRLQLIIQNPLAKGQFPSSIEPESATQFSNRAPALFAAVPSQWRSLLIVDDDGYSLSTVAALKIKGYAPRPVVETLEMALEELEDDPPDVLLCDYRLEGDLTKGMELARCALETEGVKLVIFISAEPIPAADVPRGVVVLDGLAKFDADRIHGAILHAASCA